MYRKFNIEWFLFDDLAKLRFIKFIKLSRYTIVKQMKVNYALNHDWYETSLLPQAVLNYVMSIDFIVKKSVELKAMQLCILTKIKKSVWHCVISELYFSVFALHFSLLQQVAHKCMDHMYVTITSGLLSGSSRSTSVTHFQLWM